MLFSKIIINVIRVAIAPIAVIKNASGNGN